MPAAFRSVCVSGAGVGAGHATLECEDHKITSSVSASFIFSESGFHPLLLAAYRPDSPPQEFLGTLHLSKTGGIIIGL